MSTNIVHQHGTDRLSRVLATTIHRAGDLVCERGFYGTVQDDVAAGEYFTLLLNPTVNFARVPSTLPMGSLVAAPATAQATTLPIAAAGAATGGAFAAATGGWIPFGKVIATGTATTAKIQLLNPNPYQVTMP